jgi:serine/threonine protein kinase
MWGEAEDQSFIEAEDQSFIEAEDQSFIEACTPDLSEEAAIERTSERSIMHRGSFSYKRQRPTYLRGTQHSSSLLLVTVTAAAAAFTILNLLSPTTWYDRSCTRCATSQQTQGVGDGGYYLVKAEDISDLSMSERDANNHDSLSGERTELESQRSLLPEKDSSFLPLHMLPGADGQDAGADDDVFVMATVKGDILGISKHNGNVLWKHSRRPPTGGGGSGTNSNRAQHATDDPNSIWSDDEWNRLMSPIVSTSTTTKSSSSDLHTKAVPSVDGRVFLTPPIPGDVGASSSFTASEETSYTRNLVNKSPFFDSRGRFYVGNRLSTAAAIDRDTGEILRLIKGEASSTESPSSDGDSDSHPNSGSSRNDKIVDKYEVRVLPSLEGRNVVWIGRVDHSVTVYNARTGNVDVKFASSEILSLSDMIGTYVLPGGGDGEDEGRINEPSFHAQNEFYARAIMQQQLPFHQSQTQEKNLSSADSRLSLILSTPGGKLAYLRSSSAKEADGANIENVPIQTKTSEADDSDTASNRKKQYIEWVANKGSSFSSPVAFAVSANTGRSMKVDIVPDAPIQSTSTAYLSEQLKKELDLLRKPVFSSHSAGGGSGTDGRTIVGALQGSRQLFALQLGGGESSVVHGPARPGLETGVPLSRKSPAGGGLSTINKHLTLPPLKHQRDFTQAAGGGASTSTTSSQHHYYSHTPEQGGKRTTATQHQQKSLSARKCTVQSPNYPACLIGGRDSIAPLPRLKNDDDYYDEVAGSDRHRQGDQDHVGPYQGLDLDMLLGGGGGRKGYRGGNFDLFVRIMTSWIPPVLALVIFMAFELGRRERLKTEFATLASQINNNQQHAGRTNGLLHSGNILQEQTRASDPPLLTSDNERKTIGNDTHAAMSSADHVIQVSNEILGYGGHGTVVYRGTLDGRKVAVKRMLKAYHASAEREISLLIESDGHPNVVRYFLKEVRNDFVYLALELCDLSLSDLIYAVRRANHTNGVSTGSTPTSHHHLTPARLSMSTKKTLYQIAAGVRHLHDLRIVHRDLKPQNILLALRNRREEHDLASITEKRLSDEESWKAAVCNAFEHDKLVPKISDMGLGKQLLGQSSFGASTLGQMSNGMNAANGGGASIGMGGPGSVGWQAPEVMALRSSEASFCSMDQASSEVSPVGTPSVTSRRSSRSVDIFSLGCVFHCTLLPGTHPFGEWYEREANIMRDKPDIDGLHSISIEAHDLVKGMIARCPGARPTAKEVCNHPFFWKPIKRLGFLSELSDRLEASVDTGLAGTSAVLKIEANAGKIVGLAWDKDLDPDLLSNVSKFRTYDPSSVRDCLRMIRNKYHHFDELPTSLKDKIGFQIDDLIHYFDSKFPSLLMHCYKVCQQIMPPGDPMAVKFSIHTRATLLKAASRELHLSQDVVQPEDNGANSIVQSFPAAVKPVDELPATQAINSSSNETSETLNAAKKSNGNSVEPDERVTANDQTQDVSTSFRVPENELEELAVNEPDIDILSADEQKNEKDRTECGGKDLEAPTIGSIVVVVPNDACELVEEEGCNLYHSNSSALVADCTIIPSDVVVWEGSSAAKLSSCRGWYRSEEEWRRATDATLKKARDPILLRCADDPKFRTRLCNHWDQSKGTNCPMRRKNKCVFAHGPVELRVKDGKRRRWGTLVDDEGNNNNPCHSGGEDTYGAARSIENVRREEGKWNTNKGKSPQKPKGKTKRKTKPSEATS